MFEESILQGRICEGSEHRRDPKQHFYQFNPQTTDGNGGVFGWGSNTYDLANFEKEQVDGCGWKNLEL